MASSKKPKYPVETPEESKISLTELANNPESRTPIIVCVDCSYSMLQNGRLYKMMEGLERFRRELENDPIAADSVELCIVSYGGTSARVECDFESPDRLKIPELHAGGTCGDRHPRTVHESRGWRQGRAVRSSAVLHGAQHGTDRSRPLSESRG